MKKILILFAVLMALLALPATAEEGIGVVIDGTPVTFTDAYPYTSNGRTLVPVRAVADAMGASIDWNDSTSTVTLTKGTFRAKLQISTFKLEIGDGNEIFEKGMDCRAVTKDGRTYIPARFIGYALGYDVGWEEPNVIFTHTGKQTTDFEIDLNVKFPNKIGSIRKGVEHSYYNGYGDALIANGDDGYLHFWDEDSYTFMGNAISWQFSPHNLIFDSEKFDIDIENKTWEENMDNFSAVYKEKTGENVKKSSHQYKFEHSTYPQTITVTILNETNELVIFNQYPQADFSMYHFYDYKFKSDVQGSTSKNGITPRTDQNTLLLLHTLLGEDGERIWQMMYDFYNNTGLQYVAPDTVWPDDMLYEPEFSPGLNCYNKSLRDVLPLYSFEFTGYSEYGINDGKTELSVKFITPNLKKEVTIYYSGASPSCGAFTNWMVYIPQ